MSIDGEKIKCWGDLVMNTNGFYLVIFAYWMAVATTFHVVKSVQTEPFASVSAASRSVFYGCLPDPCIIHFVIHSDLSDVRFRVPTMFVSELQPTHLSLPMSAHTGPYYEMSRIPDVLQQSLNENNNLKQLL